MDEEELKQSIIKAKQMLLKRVNKEMQSITTELWNCIDKNTNTKELVDTLSKSFKRLDEIKCELHRIEEL